MRLTVSKWHYKGQQYVQHIGPMAQEFYEQFKLGDSDKTIQLVDIDGVILSSIQGLGKKIDTMRSDLNKQLKMTQSIKGDVTGVSDLNRQLEISVQTLDSKDALVNKQFQKLTHLENDQSQRIESLNQSIKHVNNNIGRLKQ